MNSESSPLRIREESESVRCPVGFVRRVLELTDCWRFLPRCFTELFRVPEVKITAILSLTYFLADGIENMTRCLLSFPCPLL